MKFRLDTLVREFEKWFPRFEKEAGPFSVSDWGVYPDFVYEAFLKDYPFLEETWEKLVRNVGGRVEAIEWLHKVSGYEVEKANPSTFFLGKRKKRKRRPFISLRFR